MLWITINYSEHTVDWLLQLGWINRIILEASSLLLFNCKFNRKKTKGKRVSVIKITDSVGKLAHGGEGEARFVEWSGALCLPFKAVLVYKLESLIVAIKSSQTVITLNKASASLAEPAFILIHATRSADAAAAFLPNSTKRSRRAWSSPCPRGSIRFIGLEFGSTCLRRTMKWILDSINHRRRS